MLIEEQKNIPVASAEFENLDAALAVFRNFKNSQILQLSHFVHFLSVSSAERSEFFLYFENDYNVVGGRYVRNKLN